jgi:ubiquinone/menaquinone biosynthesis C-methylase UbiE
MTTEADRQPEVCGEIEAEVLRRYEAGAEEAEAGLCCPVQYDKARLDLLPREIVEKDYGCGDPSRYVESGETVLDLGSGAGKICYILAQVVGPAGRVIGVDFNGRMLALARTYQDEMAQKLGYANVRFLKGKIQDLALDLDLLEAWIVEQPATISEDRQAVETRCSELRAERPLIADDSVDVVVSNCVLNLVRPEDKRQLFREMHRVLKPSGRAVISDIVCDRDPTPAILNDPELWSGCISGAFREDLFPQAFRKAGFATTEVLDRQDEPWKVIDGVEFRSVTVRAFKNV